MPKSRKLVKLEKIISENKDFTIKDEKLFCVLCKKEVSFEKMFFIEQHIRGKKHSILKANHVEDVALDPGNHHLITQDDFAKDLCKMMATTDIPLYKLRNDNFTSFIRKHTPFTAPSETNLRDVHLKSIYVETMDSIREQIRGEYLWMSIDETTDSVGRYVANAVMGVLSFNHDVAKKRFLINTSQLEKADSSNIARFFEHSLNALGNDFNKDKVLLFVTDAAPYMKKAAKAIKTFYPKITHVTCIAHALHRVCEEIRSNFGKINSLIASVKRTFVKCPSRVQTFKAMMPNIELPPEPVITRWGTWLCAVQYYAKNFQSIVEVFEQFHEDESAAIRETKELLQNKQLKANLVNIFLT